MARISYSDMQGITPELSAELSKRPKLNIYRMLANGGNASLGYLKMGGALRFDGILEPNIRELIILRTGSLCKSKYELDHHEKIASDVGISDEKINATINDGADSPKFSILESTLLRFTDEAVIDGKASEVTFNQLSTFFSPEELIETTLLIGFYIMTSRFLQTFDMDLDKQ